MRTEYRELKTAKSKNEANELQRICEKHFHCDLKSKSRKANNVNAKMAFGTLLRKRGYTFDKVGGFINKHHATIIHYQRNIDMYLLTDDIFNERYQRVSDEFDSYCTDYKLKNPRNFVEVKNNDGFSLNLPHYNEELIKHIQYLNKEKKELYLILEKLKLQENFLKVSENRVKNIIEIVKQRTKIGTEEEIEKKLHVWFNGVYEK
ncbi:hypothetical protein N9F13_02380 [Akkermansiaceae bacterium]|nr:hypothetical protein [Akkermansiaceae bacterium]|tara:strand:- start:276 stop:890 length:615 start_codon:yes stop_codon:yes gene_type:complete